MRCARCRTSSTCTRSPKSNPKITSTTSSTGPRSQRDENGDRSVVWPGVTMYGPVEPKRSSLYLLVGTEPSRGWKTFTSEIIEAVDRQRHQRNRHARRDARRCAAHPPDLGVRQQRELACAQGASGWSAATYEGPVGILSVLADAAEKAGIPTMSIWASVPHYVHNAPSPKATLALIDKLEEVVDVIVPRTDLVQESAVWESGIDALAGDDDDMSAYIHQLEAARDAVDSPEASGEAIAEEFEKYLRRRDGREGKGGSSGPGDEPWRPTSG